VLHREDKYAERELKAIRLLRNPTHKNIITILGDGKIVGMGGKMDHYVDMELCDGSLREYIAGKRSDLFRPKNEDSISMSPGAVQRRIENAWEIMSHVSAAV
jgi:hypothetical protein